MLDKAVLINDLKEIVKPYIQNQAAFDNISEDTDFLKDLKINSANLVDVVLDIEDKYEIEIDNDAMDKMLNVKSALEVIQTKVANK